MIGKTRQTTSYDAAAGPPRGILQRSPAPGAFTHARRTPAPELAPWIMHYWLVSWDLPEGVRHPVETLPHPNVQLVFSGAGALVHGVHTAKFTRTLEGRASVFGVKFQAGGLRGWYGDDVAALRGKTAPAAEIFGPEIDTLVPVLTADAAAESEKLALANRYFQDRLPAPDAQARLAAEVVQLAAADIAIHTTGMLAARAGVSERSLQRLFSSYVGVTPKWVIRRYRLHELVERVHAGEPLDWAALAAELGYFDQSHLIADFRRLAGYTPERYRRAAATRSSDVKPPSET
ncbi:MAG: AraC family transcriptional regulator [Bryobacterales bacterium]|nr:AraC family transcriptional regulator [Bryobacterales bacterium]